MTELALLIGISTALLALLIYCHQRAEECRRTAERLLRDLANSGTEQED